MLQRPTSEGDVVVEYGATGLALKSLPQMRIFARLTDRHPTLPLYSFVQVQQSSVDSHKWIIAHDGSFRGEYGGGRAGPAREGNDRMDVRIGENDGDVAELVFEFGTWIFFLEEGYTNSGDIPEDSADSVGCIQWFTSYRYLRSVTVGVAQQLQPGQQIAEIGTLSSGARLHWALGDAYTPGDPTTVANATYNAVGHTVNTASWFGLVTVGQHPPGCAPPSSSAFNRSQIDWIQKRSRLPLRHGNWVIREGSVYNCGRDYYGQDIGTQPNTVSGMVGQPVYNSASSSEVVTRVLSVTDHGVHGKTVVLQHDRWPCPFMPEGYPLPPIIIVIYIPIDLTDIDDWPPPYYTDVRIVTKICPEYLEIDGPAIVWVNALGKWEILDISDPGTGTTNTLYVVVTDGILSLVEGSGGTGPAGPPGPAGEDGTDGADGATGSTGPAGPGVPVGGTTDQVLAKINATDYNTQWVTLSSGVTDHGALTGLNDDDHIQYALLSGRSGGQILVGGTASGDRLDLTSTSHATKGGIRLTDGDWLEIPILGSAPAAPVTGFVRFYIRSGVIGVKDETNTEVNLSPPFGTANLVYATPNGSTGTATLRSLVAADLPATVALTTNPLSQFAATTSAQLAGVISDETGTDKLVFNTNPVFVTPALGTPSSGVLTNCTGTAAGLTAGVATILATARNINGVSFNGSAAIDISGQIIASDWTSANQSTSSAGYVDLTTTQSVTFSVVGTTDVWVFLACSYFNSVNASGAAIGVDVDGADTTIAQGTPTAASVVLGLCGMARITLDNGSHTLKMQYLVFGGTGNFGSRSMVIWRK